MLALSVLLATLTPTAHAGEVTITKKGVLPAIAFVDGESVGKVKKKTPAVAQVADGPHEVAIAQDPDGTYLRCVTEVQAGASFEARDGGCSDQAWTFKDDHSVLRGSLVRVHGAETNGRWLAVDGAQRAWVMGPQGVTLNLTPGTHIVVVSDSADQSSIVCQGQIAVAAGETAPLVVTATGCVGFKDQMNVNITVN
ncbi:MAG: hypothetical protein KC912_11385 [Proteobacteria bacterium]|nr:hypothetical protein [Pseudomonadota bacterium]